MKTALITGVLGQDGAYLAKFLLEKGYRVIGTYRRTSSLDDWRLRYLNIENEVLLDCMDLEDLSNQIRVLQRWQPDEIYNLAAQSFVAVSFEQPLLTGKITGLGAANLLEAMRIVLPQSRFYQASTSEMFGKVASIPQNEETPFYPRSPYGVAKLYAHWMIVNYREAYDLYACSGILFNHESPLRGIEFVTRKITDAVARISCGKADKLVLGNLNAQRDWGFAGDYVQAMWLMLQQENPKDFVIASGETRSVRDFVQTAFEAVGIVDWEPYVETSASFYRPTEVDLLLGDAGRAKRELEWRPTTSFSELVDMMVAADMKRYAEEGAMVTI